MAVFRKQQGASLDRDLAELNKRRTSLLATRDAAAADVERLADQERDAAINGQAGDGVAVAGSRQRLVAVEEALAVTDRAIREVSAAMERQREQARRQALAAECERRAAAISEALTVW